MKERFCKFPAALQKHIVLRFGMGILFILIFTIALIYYRSIYFSLPCFIIAAILFINGLLLLYSCIYEHYLKIEGVCLAVETTRVYKRIKEIIITAEEKTLTIPIHKRKIGIQVGDTVCIYMSKNTPVYEKSGGYAIYSYYAVEIKKESASDEYPKRKITYDD